MLSSNPRRGLFVSVDGPSAAGKSTIVEHLAQLLVASGEDVHVTAEPTGGRNGTRKRSEKELDRSYGASEEESCA